ncbi:MAG: type IV toxin-antitoxin system AbiEi family antitoxin domain-containing protein [Ilumatobacteraceae bacterium]
MGEFAASRYGTFNLRQAAANGLTRHDLARLERDGVVVRVRPSVWRFAGVDLTWRHELYAATLGRIAAASHLSASALAHLDGASTVPHMPEIVVPFSASARLPGVLVRRSRQLSRSDITIIDNIPCTTMARTACDIASLVDRSTLIRVIDDIQRRGASMQWLIERAELLQCTGRSGPTEVLDIVRRRLDGYRVPDSWFERLLEGCLASPVLTGIVRQHELRSESGEFVARFDLALPWARLGIEGHSRSFHLGEIAERHDEDRDLRASAEGWEVLYLGFAATRSPAQVRGMIERVVQRRMLDLQLSAPLR